MRFQNCVESGVKSSEETLLLEMQNIAKISEKK